MFEWLRIWHLRFLSNQDAPWDGNLKWENTNHRRCSISPTAGLDVAPLCLHMPPTHPARDTPQICRLTWRWKYEWGAEQNRNGTESLTSSCAPAPLLHSPSGFAATFSHYCDAVQEWDTQTYYQKLFLISFRVCGEILMLIYSL